MNVKLSAPAEQTAETRTNPWAALVGRGSDGRGAATESLVADLTAAGVRVGGLHHVRVQDGAGKRVGYDLVDRATGRRRPLCRLSPTPDICDLEFDPTAFDDGRTWALESVDARRAQIVVIEAGPIEATGGGHRATIDALLRTACPTLLLLSVRPYSLAGLALELPDPALWLELPCDQVARHAFAEELASRARLVAAGA